MAELKTLRQLAKSYGYPVGVVVDVMGDFGPARDEWYTADSLVDPNDSDVSKVMEEYMPEVMSNLEY